MRKDALTITLVTCVAGVFGAFLRWLQNLNAFEEGTGLMKQGAGTTTAMAIYIIVAAAVFLGLTIVWLGRYSRSTEPKTAFQAGTAFPEIIIKLAAAVTLAASVVLMLGAGAVRYAGLQRVFSAFGIFGGVALMYAQADKAGKRPAKPLALLTVVLFSCMWLVFCYKNNAEDPVRWAFLVEILAVGATVMAYYEISAYFYGRAKPNAALFFIQLAAFLDITTLADGRSAILQALFIAQLAVMLTFEFLLVENMWEGKRR